jgi:UDP-2,3-diacylglucosamine pyrophosphatase LpxH
MTHTVFSDTDTIDSPRLERDNKGPKLPIWFDKPEPRSFQPKMKLRTVWISDVHLGTAGCQAGMLSDFLHSIECDTLYLVGDIVDGWRLRKGWYWPDQHNEVIRRVLKMAHRGTRVIYIPGNHDEMFRDYAGLSFGGVEVQLEAIHTTADGRNLLVTHGDAFDGIVLYARWLAFLGDQAYTLLLKANIVLNAVRRRFNLPYWSLSSYLKKRVKNAVQYIGQYEEVVAREASQRGVEGVVCGHIHCAEIRQFGSITYYNDGDWVESCTALTEAKDGTMAIVDWAAQVRNRAAQQLAVEA